MQQIVRAAMLIGFLLWSILPTSAEQSVVPSPPSEPLPQSVPQPPPSSGPGALMGLLAALPKGGVTAASPPETSSPMFQFLGPNWPGETPVPPEMMGFLLRLQGELMMRMGEVLVKYGEMIGEKKP